MLVGAYPFEDQDDPKNFRKTIQVNISLSICIILKNMSFSIFSYTNLLPRYHSSAENNVCSVQHPRLCSHISRLQTPTLPHICCKSIQGMYHSVTEFCSDYYDLIAMYCSTCGQLMDVMKITLFQPFSSHWNLLLNEASKILFFPLPGNFLGPLYHLPR